MNDNKVEIVRNLELENPMLFDELVNKKKQTYVEKNTQRALKDQNLNNNYWNLLNHLPSNQVSNIVTPLVLKMDKRSCDNLLKEILKEKKEEDQKKFLL